MSEFCKHHVHESHYCGSCQSEFNHSLAAELEQCKKESDELKAALQAELDGNKEIRKILGAKENETMFMMAERIASERTEALKALEFYANKKNWLEVMSYGEPTTHEKIDYSDRSKWLEGGHGGERARETLQKLKGGK